jgi:hypothetical protein
MRPIHRDMKLICSGGRRALGARDYSKKLTGGQDVLQVQANRLCRRGRQQPGLGAHSTLVSCCVGDGGAACFEAHSCCLA